MIRVRIPIVSTSVIDIDVVGYRHVVVSHVVAVISGERSATAVVALTEEWWIRGVVSAVHLIRAGEDWWKLNGADGEVCGEIVGASDGQSDENAESLNQGIGRRIVSAITPSDKKFRPIRLDCDYRLPQIVLVKITFHLDRRQRQIIHGRPSKKSNAVLGSGMGRRLKDCSPTNG